MGFGHEEWNLNVADAVGGYVYGYIYRSYEDLGHGTSPGPHDFYFWSRPDKSSSPLVVGVYHNAVFVPRWERARAIAQLSANGVLERRARELSKLGLPNSVWKRFGSPLACVSQEFFPSLRVRAEDVKSIDPPVSASDFFKGRPTLRWTPRYYQFAKLDAAIVRRATGAHTESAAHSDEFNEPARVDEYWRQTTADNKRIVKHEERLRKRLEGFLRGRKPPPILKTEVGHTDLIAELEGQKCLMELKTCTHAAPKIATRAAVGQLLYYAFHKKSGSEFAGGTPPTSMCIVLDEEPDSDTRDWLRELSKLWIPKTDIVWLSGSSFTPAFGLTPFF